MERSGTGILPVRAVTVALRRAVGKCLQIEVEHADSVNQSYEPKLSSDELEVLSMMDRQDIDQLAQRLVSLVPSGLAQAQQDLRTNFGDVLAQGLRRLDLVTREEFDVQTQLLARTRAKVEALEKRIADLEAGAGA